MADYLRQQGFQGQAQQASQPPHLQQASQFQGLGVMPRLNGMQLTPSQLQLLQQQQQQRQQQASLQGMHMPNNNNMMAGLGNNLTPQMAQLLAAQRGANGGIATNSGLQMQRQLGLLNTARNQQPQNGPVNFSQQGAPFGGQLGGNQFPHQQGMFQQPKPEESRPPVPPQQQIGAMANGMPNALINGVPNGAATASAQPFLQGLQEFMRTKDGRALTQDELKVKAAQLKRDIEGDKMRLNELLSKNPNHESVGVVRNVIQQKDIIYMRVSQLLMHAGIPFPHQGQQGPQAGPGSNENQGQIPRFVQRIL